MPTHRGEHRLPTLLDALKLQDYEGTWEVLVVVDGRLDASSEILERYTEALPLRVHVHETAQGVTSAMNAGFEHASGRIVVRCDDDLTPGPTFVSDHMAHHQHGPRGVVGPTRDVFPDGAYADAYGRPANARSLAAAYARAEEDNWIGWAANNSAPREAILQENGFDPAFVYGQDSELGYRLHKRGLPILVEAALEVEHRGPSTSASTRVPRAFVSGASKRLFYLKHPETLKPRSPVDSVQAWVWQHTVRTLASILRTRESFASLGRFLDRALKVLPVGLSGRLIALSVEAAGRSGFRNGVDDLTTYKGQKTTELQREIGVIRASTSPDVVA